MEETARQAAGDLGARLAAAARRLAEATGWMAAAELNDRFAGAVPYLRAFALTLGGHYLLKAAAAEGVEDGPRAAMAAFHIRQLLPQAIGALRRGLRGGGAALRHRTRAIEREEAYMGLPEGRVRYIAGMQAALEVQKTNLLLSTAPIVILATQIGWIQSNQSNLFKLMVTVSVTMLLLRRLSA